MSITLKYCKESVLQEIQKEPNKYDVQCVMAVTDNVMIQVRFIVIEYLPDVNSSCMETMK